jgi:hypothetical protein
LYKKCKTSPKGADEVQLAIDKQSKCIFLQWKKIEEEEISEFILNNNNNNNNKRIVLLNSGGNVDHISILTREDIDINIFFTFTAFFTCIAFVNCYCIIFVMDFFHSRHKMFHFECFYSNFHFQLEYFRRRFL